MSREPDVGGKLFRENMGAARNVLIDEKRPPLSFRAQTRMTSSF